MSGNIETSSYENSEAEFGGKGYKLDWLRRQGFNVPGFIVFPSSQIRELLEDLGVSLEFRGLPLEEVKIKLAEVREQIASAKLNPASRHDLSERLSQIYSEDEYFAVRSSAIGEDSVDASFAGQMDSFSVSKGMDQIESSFWNCISSFYNERAYLYRLEKNISVENICGAVVIQKMIFGQSSGVMFTAHPSTGNRRQGLISSCFGIGEGVVSGVCNTDEFVVDLLRNEIVSEQIQTKDVQCVFDEKKGFGTHEITIAKDLQESPSLSQEQIKTLTKIAAQISSLQGHPQDIEFCTVDEEIFILQTRPVTNLPSPRKPQGKEIVWDNSNIQESYNGVTTPLTFTFANRAYTTVYTETCKALKVSRNQVEELGDSLENLLGLVNGRVYYNINNWYRGLSVLPSFGTNKEDMERMMGLQDEVDFVSGTKYSFAEKLQRAPQVLKTLWTLLGSFKKMPQLVEEFLSNFEKNIAASPGRSPSL